MVSEYKDLNSNKIETQEQFDAWYLKKLNSAESVDDLWVNLSGEEQELSKKFKPTMTAELVLATVKNSVRLTAITVADSFRKEYGKKEEQ